MHLNDLNKQGLWRARQHMIENQLRARQISDERVLAAMGKIPRELFVREALRDRAYEDSPLPIGDGQTISQPFMVALMTELLHLTGSEKVLEIGTGSGYQAAVLAELAGKVFTIERHHDLARRARKTLEGLGYTNVLTHIGDGTIGWTEFAPYDRIIVTAGAPSVPESLLKQLSAGGIMAAPVGDKVHQKLLVLTKSESGVVEKDSGGCVFVPLIGREGWSNG
ncbi:protein-L-isoaspartate(D-aspartate) O-methyltransferase [bacterium]|nr:protein-L-isoaspartate(D-aspartate) O-methyltransferase [bacterium]MBU1653030.1 protein-L-isoaspartate(D-aspartate) O-methyltransferase [bacterium]MBU1881310.1 protein-L-isoaspartate(D-aspartate) O-methyltransferase [bacterium]